MFGTFDFGLRRGFAQHRGCLIPKRSGTRTHAWWAHLIVSCWRFGSGIFGWRMFKLPCLGGSNNAYVDFSLIVWVGNIMSPVSNLSMMIDILWGAKKLDDFDNIMGWGHAESVKWMVETTVGKRIEGSFKAFASLLEAQNPWQKITVSCFCIFQGRHDGLGPRAKNL